MHHIHVEFDDGPRIGALRDFGFDDGFLLGFAAEARSGELPGRVIGVQRGRCTVVVEAGGSLREVEASSSPTAVPEAYGGRPAVGDWVALRLSDERGAPPAEEAFSSPESELRGSIRAILPRRTSFSRKGPGDVSHDKVEEQVIAANVDVALIVMAAGRDWNPRRLERYLALARGSGAAPVLVITKTDLAEDAEALISEASRIAVGVPCAAVCAPEGIGLDSLSPWLEPGQTAVLLGSSGAGKSTLLNAIAGRQLAKTKEVRADDERGRHTTSHRQLFRLDSGALVIDTPGMREIQLWAEQEAVDSVFAEIEGLASACRFRDCAHEGEPGCAVLAALETGLIDTSRYEAWQKLKAELRFLKRREDPAARRAEAEKWKAINKSMRGYTKERRAAVGKSRDA